jgi:hypothetical protein
MAGGLRLGVQKVPCVRAREFRMLREKTIYGIYGTLYDASTPVRESNMNPDEPVNQSASTTR